MLRLGARMIRQGIFFEIKLLLSARPIQNERSKTDTKGMIMYFEQPFA